VTPANRRSWLLPLSLLLVAIAAFALWLYFTFQAAETLPATFASGNGRIEATEVDIATKLAGRLKSVDAREGDMVEAGKIMAHMDTDDLQAQYREARASLKQAEENKRYAEALVAQTESELNYADKELSRMKNLVRKGHVSQESVDQAMTAQRSAAASLQAAQVQVASATAGIEVAQAAVERIAANLADSQLKTPIAGRVLYRLAEPGEVLAAGGKVLTVLDISDVYMTIFLPTSQAGRVTVGSDARITLDPIPDYVIPAQVSFVAAEAQFTPKSVETRSEREKLMFRVKIKIDPELLRAYRDRVKTGVPGEAYVRLDQDTSWPQWLNVKLPSE